MRIRADHAYIVGRFLHWAQRGGDLELFLAALAVELYLKSCLVSRLGRLPREFIGGRKGHNLRLLLERARREAGPDAVFADEHLPDILERLTKMNVAGRYTNTGFAAEGLTTDLWYILDRFIYHVRSTIEVPDNFRDEITQLLGQPIPAGSPHPGDFARQALRDAFFAFNRPYRGWFLTEDDRQIREDGSPWD